MIWAAFVRIVETYLALICSSIVNIFYDEKMEHAYFRQVRYWAVIFGPAHFGASLVRLGLF